MERLRRSLRWIATPTLTLSCLASSSWAGTINVPADQPTIQAAINAAAPGDQILVQPGVYHEAISISGNPISLQLIGIGGPSVTTIDATGFATSAVTAAALAGNQTMIKGFTITGGTGQYQPNYQIFVGGGIYIAWGNVTVEDCVITGNSVSDPTFVNYGGGVYHIGDSSSLVNCTIANNHSNEYGGGIAYAGDPPLIVNGCTIENNTSRLRGAGLYCDFYPFAAPSPANVTNCLIANNASSEGSAGGMFGGVPENCSFIGNSTPFQGGGYMVQLLPWGIPTPVTLKKCKFFANTAGQFGAAAYLRTDPTAPSTILVSELLVSGNQAALKGDGLYLASSAVVDRCTLNGNNLAGAFEAKSTIIRNHPIPIDSVTSTVSFSNIAGGFAGVGNIDADPLFANAGENLFQLLPNSPCIGSGEAGSDMGALAYSPIIDLGKGLAGTQEIPKLSGSGTLVPNDLLTVSLENAKPNGTAYLLLSVLELNAPFKGGTLVPHPDPNFGFLIPLPTDASGGFALGAPWPTGLPSGLSIYAQFVIPDPAAVQGFAISNAMLIVNP